MACTFGKHTVTVEVNISYREVSNDGGQSNPLKRVVALAVGGSGVAKTPPTSASKVLHYCSLCIDMCPAQLHCLNQKFAQGKPRLGGSAPCGNGAVLANFWPKRTEMAKPRETPASPLVVCKLQRTEFARRPRAAGSERSFQPHVMCMCDFVSALRWVRKYMGKGGGVRNLEWPNLVRSTFGLLKCQ